MNEKMMTREEILAMMSPTFKEAQQKKSTSDCMSQIDKIALELGITYEEMVWRIATIAFMWSDKDIKTKEGERDAVLVTGDLMSKESILMREAEE